MTADVTRLAVGPLPAPPADEKRFATLQAQAALVGVQLHRIDGDDGRPSYIATKWAMTASFGSLDETAAWLRRFAGVSAE